MIPLTLLKGLSEAEAHIARQRKKRNGQNGNPNKSPDTGYFQPLSEAKEQLSPSPDAPLAFSQRVRLLRNRLGLSQAQFSDRYGLPLRTVQNWEQGRRTKPDASGELLIGLIERNPDGMANLVGELHN